MTEQKQLEDVLFSKPMIKRAILGGAIALTLITVFLLGVDNPDPAWPKYWKIRPLVVVTIAGAAGGAFYYLMSQLGKEGTWKRIFTTLLGMIGYVVAIWMGSVLGLDGTLWN